MAEKRLANQDAIQRTMDYQFFMHERQLGSLKKANEISADEYSGGTDAPKATVM